MKKLLSAIFAMIMLAAIATFTGAALADTYKYEPADGKPVAYVSKGTDGGNEVYVVTKADGTTANVADGAGALTLAASSVKDGGYVVMLCDVDTSATTSYCFTGASGDNIITYMGAPDATTKINLKAKNMCSTNGNAKFDYLHFTIEGGSDNSLRACADYNGVPMYKLIMGENLTGGFTLTGGNLEIYGGSFGSIRFAQWGQTQTYDHINIKIGGNATVSNITATWVDGKNCTVNNDVNIEVVGGTFPGYVSISGGTSTFNVKGNYNLTITGGKVSGDVTFAANTTVSGTKTLSMIDYPEGADKNAVAAKVKTDKFDIALISSVYVSDNGDDSADGTAEAPVKTLAKAVEKLGASDGAIFVTDTLTLTGAESARTAEVTFMSATSNAVVNISGDYTIGGTTTFKNITIKNGGDGAIIAGGKKLVIKNDVKTAEDGGKYIDIVAGNRDDTLITVNVSIEAGTYNAIYAHGLAGSTVNVSAGVKTIDIGAADDYVMYAHTIVNGTVENASIEVSDFANDSQALKVTPKTGEKASIELTTGGSQINGAGQSFVRVEYYVHGKSGETLSYKPILEIGEKIYQAQLASKIGWNVANFTISDAGKFSTFKFYPYGDNTAAASHNKNYICSIAFSQLENKAELTYDAPTMTVGGDFIPVLADFKMTSTELVNTSDISSVTVEETPFAVGTAVKITPTAATGAKVDYYVLEDGSITTLRGDFRPYVRVEYYLYAREGESFAEAKPTIQIGAKTYVAAETLKTNEWAVATFNITDESAPFQSFSFYPYGTASGLNEWNKLYVQQITFSQTENLVAPVYAKPDMTENGELVPYVFEPGDGIPVVYVTVGGVYSGDYTGSTDSTKAYGSLSAAFGAIDSAKLEKAYVIMLDDIDVERTVPSHTSMMILRGKEKEDGSKVQLVACYMTSANGPLTLENLELYWRQNTAGTNNDLALRSGASKLVVGKQGVPNDVTVKTYGGGNSLTLTGGDITINSGSWAIRFGEWGAQESYKEINITLNGGTLGYINATHSTATSTTTVSGDVNVTVNGGTVGGSFAGIGNVGTFTVGGNVNYTFTGGNFNSVKDGSIVPAVKATINGKKTIDILDYVGSTTNLASKINRSAWDVLNINSVYLKNGGTGDGSSADNAFGNLADAVKACYQVEDNGAIVGGKIVICGDGYTVDGTVSEGTDHSNTILYTSENNAPLNFAAGYLTLNGPAKFNNIKLVMENSDESAIVANGHALTIGENVTTVPYEGKYLDIIGGKPSGKVETVNVTVNGGDFGKVISGDSVTGNSNITLNGGTIHDEIVGGTSVANGVIGGNVTITINDGNIKGNIIGGSVAENGSVEGIIYINLNGGTYSVNTTITATNLSATSTVAGNAEITINGGDFSAMMKGQIQPGSGFCGDKICVDYKNYEGSVDKVEEIISKNFDVVVAKPQEKPTFTPGDKFIFIIDNIGDPTKALTKAIPFKINQTAPQSGDPIVVSPKQLNIKMDGADHATMTLQTVKETADTIRFVPNHNPTKGSSIVVDGYNINGRGVDVAKYKYIEIVYYYTVPEGSEPAVQNMCIRPLSDHASCAAGTSGDLVTNKWATTLIDMSESFAGKTGALKQYHFYPMGNGKKGTDVPTDQYIDIISMTFYTDKPNTIIQGGSAPDAKVEAAEAAKKEETKKEETKKPTKIEDINVSVANIKSTVDNSGSFTSASVTFDGLSCMEYTPNIQSEKTLAIEGYNVMGKVISLNEYQYVTMKIYVKTDRTDVQFKPTIFVYGGGVQGNPEAVANATIVSDTALVPNQWNTVTLKLTPADPAKHLTRQFHICLVGSIKANTMVKDEKFYLAEFVLSAQPPKAPVAAGEEEIVEDEAEVIAESPEIVVDGSKLINSYGDYATFKSTVGEFDGKQVVMIKPSKVNSPVAIDGSAIFGNTELTPNGAMSLATHRYAIVSYYYSTKDETTERIPEFELLGGRIQSQGNVVNGVTAKGDSALKKNEWATAVVKLTGNGSGTLMSGFSFKPFGTTAASNVASNGDVLYIENITFVSNRP